jgi:excisionase family DNA binding protein
MIEISWQSKSCADTMLDKLKSMGGAISRAAVHKDGATSSWQTPTLRIIPAWALQQRSDPKPGEEIASPVGGKPHSSSCPFAPLMTIGETATILHVAPRTIRRMIKRGELHAVRIGRSLRIRRQDIERIIFGVTDD